MNVPTKEPCPICGKLLKKTSIKRHVATQHVGKKEEKGNRESQARAAAVEILTNPNFNQGTIFGSATQLQGEAAQGGFDYRVPVGFDAESEQDALHLEDWDFMEISGADDQSKRDISDTKPKKRLQPEAAVQKKMEKKLGGGHKVIPYSIIDIWTPDTVCEIKHWDGWIKAIGQVIVYTHVYPNHMKHIHFFGQKPPMEKEVYIRGVCAKLGIKVTHE